MPTKLGKRYTCEECGGTYLVVRAGSGDLHCHGREVGEQAVKQLPSSD